MTFCRIRSALLATTIAGGAIFLPFPLLAQTTEPAEAVDPQAAPGADIVVTGTRIQRPDLEVASPVNVIGENEIALRQQNTAEELLRDLPGVRPALGSAVNAGDDRSATIDLRGLGANRTLVLLDGRRVVPFGLEGVVDTNVIPVALVQRVDVVTGGASSTYGADAVAGVVNFITRRNFEGVEVSGNYRITGRGDARSYSASAVMGANLADRRGNVVLALSYIDRASLLVGSREVGKYLISSATGQFSGATASYQTIFTSPNTAALGLPASSIGAVVNPATGLLRPATVADTFNGYEGVYFQTPLRQYNAYAAGHYEISSGIEAYASALFSRNEAGAQTAPSGTFNAIFQLPLNNAYLPQGIRGQLCGAVQLTATQCAAAAAAQGPGSPGYREIPVIAQRRFTEYGPRGNPVTATTFQLQGGLRGKIGGGLRYDVSAQFGETRQNQVRENWGSYSRVQQALRSYRNGAGAAVCSDAANGCVPINLFGPNGSITPDQIAFFDLDALINRVVRQTVVTGNLGGDLFGLTSPLAASPIAFSVGGEYRRISARSNPDAASQVQGEVLGSGARTPPDVGAYSVREAFAELIAPLVSDVPGIHALQLEAGIRYSDYSSTGASTTWKAGGAYEPVRGVKLRGMYQVAVRSPNIQELFQSPVTGLGNLNPDPCQASQLASAGANPGLAALCVATGAPPGSIGSIPAPTTGQINLTTSGNRNLDVERARTYTFGLVLAPSLVRGFSATIDYFHIRVTGAISTPSVGDIVNGCYSAALNPGREVNAFCALIRRNPLTGSLNGGGETPGVILASSNLGAIETAGIDASLNYQLDLRSLGADIGTLSFGLNGTWLDYYHFQATPNSINRDCTGYYSQNCTNPRPKWKWNSRLTYSRGPFDISLLWSHLSRVRLEPFQAAATTPLTTPQPGGPNPSTVLERFRKVRAADYFDLAFRARIADRFQFTLTVDNLFDRQPPLLGNGVGGSAFNSGNTFPSVYDVLGRTFSAGVRMTF